MKQTILIMAAMLFATIAIAQPPRDQWVHSYGDRLNDYFWDVYLTEAGNYACGGKKQEEEHNLGEAWLVVVDENGDEIINELYGQEGISERINSLIEVDGGGFLLGGNIVPHPRNVFAVRTDADGEEIWTNEYGTAGNDNCYAVIELKDRNFLLAGVSSSPPDDLGFGMGDGYLLKIDGDGELIWEHWYGSDRSDCFFAMREVEDGILLAGRTNSSDDGWLLKTDEEGEMEWQRAIGDERYSYQVFYSLISCRGGGFLAAGMSANPQEESWEWLVRLNEECNPIWQRFFDHENQGYAYWARGVIQMPDNGFTFVGGGPIVAAYGGIITRTDAEGNEMWSRVIPDIRQQEADVNAKILTSVVITPDESIVACGHGRVRGEQGSALLIKCVPERSAPIIIRTYPELLEFEVLLGDTVQFDVDVVDLQEDSLLYRWEFEGEEISTDTCVTIIFEDLGDFSTFVEVSDGELADSARWLTHVTEFYIDGFTPDSLQMRIRRGSSIDFSLDVRVVENIELDYLWTLFGRDRRGREIGDSDTITVAFNLTGDHRLEGSVRHGNVLFNINWMIDVRSAVWYWWPREDSLTVPVGYELLFAIAPFNPDSDSLEYLWTLDGDSIDFEQEIEILFEEMGLHEVVAYVHDGCEADTIRWEVTVVPLVSAPEDAHLLLPTEPVLYPPNPNPFNSTVSLKFYLPESNRAVISISDLSGREISSSKRYHTEFGEHEFIWNAMDSPAGLYFAILESNNQTIVRKLLLIK